jgi:hypothetical protein
VSTAADVATLREEQSHDETLKPCFVLAKQDKGGFFSKDGLLYRRETIAGQPCEQLVLPISRREQVPRLAHDTFGGHVGVRNTKERIRFKFLLANVSSRCKVVRSIV